ncbi:glycosyltransferase family 9 protein [Clostridium sp. LQ25]|uniref:glycosyltransferase family 9 protein n=1 Tax=Clostridium sp. LQ25 TaxID=2992805 RepID=UPI002251E461|nr:glycosyltransferase family 9 protein [Clostridium sp. LQ25]UZT05996.1 glycosyltransferase family 9 protein [Clostridium sp. LQ25]
MIWKGNHMRFLIFGGPGIGDVVITLPMAVALKEKYKDCKVDYIVSSNKSRFGLTKNLLKYQDYFDNVMYYNLKELKHDIKLIKILRGRNYDMGFICQYHNSESSVWPSRIFKIAGCKSVGIEPINKKIKYDYNIKVKKGIHITDYCFSLLQQVNIYTKPNVNCIFDVDKIASYDRKTTIKKTNKEIAVICIGTGKVSISINGKKKESDNKSWNINNWIKLSNLLVEDNFEVVLLGGIAESKLIKSYSSTISPKVINLVNNTSIGESLDILSKASIVIGADTGMMHCAAALGKKTISLFGCTDPKEYEPYGSNSESIFLNLECSPCFGTENSVTCKKRNCMNNISVNHVLSIINS